MASPILVAALLSVLLFNPSCAGVRERLIPTTPGVQITEPAEPAKGHEDPDAGQSIPVPDPATTPDALPEVPSATAPAAGITKPAGWKHFTPMITLNGPVTDTSVKEVNGLIDQLNNAHVEAIVLRIDSPGGSVPAGWELMRGIEGSDVPVYCVVDHMGASMAFYILQSCKVRAMTTRSILLIHKVRSQAGAGDGTIEGAKFFIEELERETKLLEEAAIGRMKITLEQLDARITDEDWWVEPSEAMKIGAVDMLVGTGDEFFRRVRDNGKP